MTNSLVPIQHKTLTVPGLDLPGLGKVLAASGYFKDVRQEAQAIVKVLYGAELGIGPISSMMGVHIIDGKPAYSANIMAAAVKKSGRYTYRIRTHTDQECNIEFFEGQDSLGVSTFTMADAQRAGLSGKPIWKNYPKNMLFNRAMANGFRFHCPDLTGGAPAYTPEELGVPVDGDGNVLEATAQTVEEPRVHRVERPAQLDGKATREQLKAILEAGQRIGLDAPGLEQLAREKWGCKVRDLTVGQAGTMLTALHAMPDLPPEDEDQDGGHDGFEDVTGTPFDAQMGMLADDAVPAAVRHYNDPG